MVGGAARASAVAPIPPKEHSSILFVEKRRPDALASALVVVDNSGVRTEIPINDVACLVREPGARISHAAVALAARRERWSDGSAKRVSALQTAGRPCGARSDRLLFQSAPRT